LNPNLDYISQSLRYPNGWKLEDYEKKSLLISCTGRNVWEDIRKIDYSDMDVMGVKDTIVHFPDPIHHAFSQHVDQLVHLVAIRNMRNPSTRRQTNEIMSHTSNDTKHSSVHAWNLPGHGTSSLGAVYVGLALGYRRVVLAGCPLDDEGHYYDPEGVKTHFIARIPDRDNGPRFWEHAAKHVFKGKVKSLSGRTKDLLGAP
jgi:hypothetical protein